jgi:hypothetical protein
MNLEVAKIWLWIHICTVTLSFSCEAKAQGNSQVAPEVVSSLAEKRVENVILVTLDGLRPEEVFTGADPRLMIPELGVRDPERWMERYGGDSAEIRRRRLLPFFGVGLKSRMAGSPADSSMKVKSK